MVVVHTVTYTVVSAGIVKMSITRETIVIYPVLRELAKHVQQTVKDAVLRATAATNV